MRKRSSSGVAAIVAIVAAAVAVTAPMGRAGAALPGAPTPKPNVVFILTDDETMTSVAHMPFLSSQPDGHWVNFPNAFLTTPLCCPSRSTILSGEYPFRTGVETNRLGHLLDESSTIATWLDTAGYHTGLIGRYLNLYPFDRPADYIPPGWDYWAAMEDVGYYDWTMNENGQLLSYGNAEADYAT